MAKLVERSVDAILKIERGVSLSGLDTLIRLAEPLGVTVADLLEPLWQEGTRDPAATASAFSACLNAAAAVSIRARILTAARTWVESVR